MELSEMTSKPRGEVEIGGRVWALVPLDLNDFADIELQFGKDTTNWSGIAASRFILWLVLRKQDATLTEQQVGAMISVRDFERMGNAVGVLMDRDEEGAESKNE